MSKESIILAIGVVMLFLPSLGVPDEWKRYTFMAFGLTLVVLGYLLRRGAYFRKHDNGKGELSTDSFVESLPTDQEEEKEDEEVDNKFKI